MNKKIKNIIFNLVGAISLLIGIIGIFLPLLPTTPFLLLSAFLFSKGSNKFHSWLINHKYLGKPIKDWEKNKSISVQSKLLATATFVFSGLILFLKPKITIPLKMFFLIFAIFVLSYIWSRPRSK